MTRLIRCGDSIFEWWGFDRKVGRHTRGRDISFGFDEACSIAYLLNVLRLFGWKFLSLWALAGIGRSGLFECLSHAYPA
ncbi:MAG: hypothetical protein HQ515_02985 [Phycisphaeraceae bacterium]|nr:hypothetical protein [Phycisphaeraceae bacterium]